MTDVCKKCEVPVEACDCDIFWACQDISDEDIKIMAKQIADDIDKHIIEEKYGNLDDIIE